MNLFFIFWSRSNIIIRFNEERKVHHFLLTVLLNTLLRWENYENAVQPLLITVSRRLDNGRKDKDLSVSRESDQQSPTAQISTDLSGKLAPTNKTKGPLKRYNHNLNHLLSTNYTKHKKNHLKICWSWYETFLPQERSEMRFVSMAVL